MTTPKRPQRQQLPTEAAEPGARTRARMVDVAKATGVSTVSVSNALSGAPGVSQETRARILEAAAALGFRPNQIASSLRRGQSKVFGLMVPDVSNPFSSELAAGVLRAAAAHDFAVFVSQSNPGEPPGESLGFLLDHQVAGLVISSLAEADRSLLGQLLEHEIPVVQLIRQASDGVTDFAGIDDAAAAREVVGHLVGLGHRNITVAIGPLSSTAQRDRLLGFREGLRDAGLDLADDCVVVGELTREGGYLAAESICETFPGLPDAVVCGNDMMAIGVIDALIDRGLRVPEDVAVTGFDDVSLASSRLVGLTTVRVPRRRLGAAAIGALISRIENPSSPLQTLLLPHTLMVRRTCGNSTWQSSRRSSNDSPG